MRSIFASVGLALALVGFAAPQASATPITYEFSGTGSGTIGGTSFTGALLVFTGTADTANVQSFSFMGDTFYAVGLDSLTVSIAGIGTATLTQPAEVFGIPQAFVDPDGEIPAIPLVILGRIDNPPDLTSFTGIANAGSNALAGYDLTTSIGPVGDSGVGGVGFFPACGLPGNDPCLATSMGALIFTGDNERGDGRFRATVAQVPEPSLLLLVGGGAVVLVRRSRRSVRA